MKQYQDKGQNTYRLEQSVVVLGVWLSLLEGSRSAASYHKALDDAFGLLRKAYSMQQETHQGVWQLEHFAAPGSSDCQQSYTKHVTSRRTDWQLPTKYKARLARRHQLLDISK